MIWILILFNKIPYSVFELSHVEVLLVAAPLWLIPLSWNISQKQNWLIWLALSCGLFFTISFQLPKGILAGLLIIPWFLLTIILGIQKLSIFKSKKVNAVFQNVPLYCETAAFLYLPIGVFWALMDRFEICLFGYDPTIILLTAVHFHYAGFILPQVASWLIEKKHFEFSKIIGFGIILGIPLVAIGISATHFGWHGWIEVFCVSIMTLVGSGLGGLYIYFGLKVKEYLPKVLFLLGGIALLVGMSLAFCYGWRHVFVIETLTIPWMYAVHGTCNAVGFAAPVLVGWKLVKK